MQTDPSADQDPEGNLDGQTRQGNDESLPPKPPEALTPPDPTQDIADLRAELAATKAEMAEEVRRTRQSFKEAGKSIVERVHARYAEQARIIDRFEKAGRLTPEEAALERSELRNTLEAEEFTAEENARRQTRAAETTSLPNLQVAEFQARADEIFAGSTLKPDDPEAVALADKKIPANYDAKQAAQLYRRYVKEGEAAKATRLANEKKGRIERARDTLPVPDTSSSSNEPPPDRRPKATLDDADDLAEELVKKFIKTPAES